MHLVQGIHGQGSFEYAAANGFLGEDVVAVHCYRIDEAASMRWPNPAPTSPIARS